MKSTRNLICLTTAVVLALGGVSTASSEAHTGHVPGGDASGAAVRAWNEIAVKTLIDLPGPAGGAPPAAQVHVAMVQGAVFDAVNAIGRKHYRSYLLTKRFSARASKDAAVAAAAYGVLREIVSTVPNVPEASRATVLATLATQYGEALALIPDGWSETKGTAAGQAAAAAMIAARADDGRFGPSQWVPNPAPGHWWPQTNPATGQPVLDPTPWVGGVDPFTVKSSSQFRTRGPLRLSSAKWAKEFNEVKAIGAVSGSTRTTTQTYIARWWQSTPVKSWNDVSRELAMRNGLGALETARLLALQNLSGGDAAINCWNDKYHWDFWRPWNAIQRAAEDGNPATTPDPAWLPLIAAPYPDHPSGHLCLDGAHTRILRMFFGDRVAGGFSITSISPFLQPADATTRSFDSFSRVLDEIVEARIWAGLHFRTADLQGKTLGLRVAKYTAAHYLQPVHRHHHHH
ncbi:vanadium-dependent haloperoxidase [Nocardioides sp. W7]|uniref:vanadium-dependent haloperoxidase n=1 Tax=Nocardioides sp. W7 TaxID=2931390 RepID=UPI001FD4C7CD|nr:vanadium-dependent haloperoxidase [Nocardioides sp. W7]